MKKTQRSLAGQTPTARATHALMDMAKESPAREYLRKVCLPHKEAGAYKIKTYSVSEGEAKLFNFREALHGHRFIEPGTYTALTENGSIWMTDTPAELVDHIEVVDRAYHYGGYILVLGLGLGMVVQAVLEMPQVVGCTVVDISSDVIELVAPTYKRRYGKRFNVVCADALTWKPDHLYSAVWADIWSSLSGENLPEIAKLRKRYKDHGWFGAWGEAISRAHEREINAELRYLKQLSAERLAK